jgi:phosphomannomutase
VNELGALAGFEKSGHFFFNAPVGRGYDDGLLTAIAVCEMLDRNPDQSMADLYRALPKTWGSPTMSPHCADEVKYAVVERVVDRFARMGEAGEAVAGQPITELVTVNGVRVATADGTWGLVVHHRTSPSSSWSLRARFLRIACGPCSRPSMPSCAKTQKSGPIINVGARDRSGAHAVKP